MKPENYNFNSLYSFFHNNKDEFFYCCVPVELKNTTLSENFIKSLKNGVKIETALAVNSCDCAVSNCNSGKVRR